MGEFVQGRFVRERFEGLGSQTCPVFIHVPVILLSFYWRQVAFRVMPIIPGSLPGVVCVGT